MMNNVVFLYMDKGEKHQYLAPIAHCLLGIVVRRVLAILRTLVVFEPGHKHVD